VQIYRWLLLLSHLQMTAHRRRRLSLPSHRRFLSSSFSSSSCKNTRPIKINNIRIGAFYVSHFLCCYILPVDSIIDDDDDGQYIHLDVPWAYFHSFTPLLFSFFFLFEIPPSYKRPCTFSFTRVWLLIIYYYTPLYTHDVSYSLF
jgi:hypothetical protein